jgi:hypothetical protein
MGVGLGVSIEFDTFGENNLQLSKYAAFECRSSTKLEHRNTKSEE